MSADSGSSPENSEVSSRGSPKAEGGAGDLRDSATGDDFTAFLLLEQQEQSGLAVPEHNREETSR